MKRKLYAIRDLKANIFNTPVAMDNDATAIRSFGDLVSGDKTSLVALHPSDFALCFIGEFDIEKGILLPADTGYVQLACGNDFAKGE